MNGTKALDAVKKVFHVSKAV